MQAERIVVYFPKESLPTSKRHPKEKCTFLEGGGLLSEEKALWGGDDRASSRVTAGQRLVLSVHSLELARQTGSAGRRSLAPFFNRRGMCMDDRNSRPRPGNSHENEPIFRTRTSFRAVRVRGKGVKAN